MTRRYHVEYSKAAEKAIAKMDAFDRKLVLSWIDKNLEGSANPRLHGKGLTGNHSGEWRYRIGEYRVIVEIKEQKLIILVLATGHRHDIYDKRL